MFWLVEMFFAFYGAGLGCLITFTHTFLKKEKEERNDRYE
jgi:hypothetical protein